MTIENIVVKNTPNEFKIASLSYFKENIIIIEPAERVVGIVINSI